MFVMRSLIVLSLLQGLTLFAQSAVAAEYTLEVYDPSSTLELKVFVSRQEYINYQETWVYVYDGPMDYHHYDQNYNIHFYQKKLTNLQAGKLHRLQFKKKVNGEWLIWVQFATFTP